MLLNHICHKDILETWKLGPLGLSSAGRKSPLSSVHRHTRLVINTAGVELFLYTTLGKINGSREVCLMEITCTSYFWYTKNVLGNIPVSNKN